MPAQGRPQAAGRSSQFQPGKYEIFQAGGCPTRKSARSQPEANQTSFFDSQKPAKPGKQRPDLARQPCRELRKCSLFRDVQGEIDAWAASQAHTWNCAIYFASFVGGAVPAQGRPWLRRLHGRGRAHWRGLWGWRPWGCSGRRVAGGGGLWRWHPCASLCGQAARFGQ